MAQPNFAKLLPRTVRGVEVKVIIAGSREITDFTHVEVGMAEVNWSITEVVSGGARGVDKLGEDWADLMGIPYRQFIPEWDAKGKGAGYARNVEMATYADALVAFWDNNSSGTKHMIDIALNKGLGVHVVQI